MNLEDFLKVASGERKADLLIKNARIVNVLSNEIVKNDVAVSGGRICGFGDYRAKKTIDIKNRYLLPGYIDGHIHIESSMVTVSEFAKTVVPLGTTQVVADPHEIANVLGLDGIRYMLDSSKYQPLEVYFMMPSCVPATDLETSGAVISAGDIFPYLSEKWVVGLGEMMNYPGVLSCEKGVLDKIKLVTHKKIDGHAPGLTGKELSTYIAAGIMSDHESTTLKEAREKLRKGMHIMIREGTATKNLEALLPLVNAGNSSNFSFVSDDRSPADLINEGHMNYIVWKAIDRGLDPVLAVKLATINTARYFRIHGRGAIAPGFEADMQVLTSFKKKTPVMVFKSGNIVAEEGRLKELSTKPRDIVIRGSMNSKQLNITDFMIRAKKKNIKTIKIVPSQITTKYAKFATPSKDGYLISDIKRDLLKIYVIDRHRASGNIGIGMLNGMGLREGAIASSIAHDSHNIVVTGVSDEAILAACNEIVRMGGGICVVKKDKMVDGLELPIAGLMSERPVEEVNRKLSRLIDIARSMGAKPKNPFFILSFLCLPVIPELKITDKGLVDVKKNRIVDLFDD
ncbi:MAG: adenine deaminase [Elusimicrobiota bacterium]